MTDTIAPEPMRPVIVVSLVVCLAVAIAPWFEGGQEPVALLVSGMVLLLGALLARLQPEVRSLRRGLLSVSFAVLIGLGLLSLAWTANRYSSVVWVVQWMMAGLAFRLAYTVAGEPKGRDQLLRVYLGSAAVFALAGVWMYLTGAYDRFTGPFYWANPAAGYLIPAIMLGWDGVRRATGRRGWWWVALVVGLLAAFWLTDSRGATLVLGAVSVVYLLVVPLTARFWWRLALILGFSYALSVGFGYLGQRLGHHSSLAVPGSRFGEALSGDSSSLSDRWYYADSALNMWFDHPLGGVGAGAYGDVHPQYQQRVVSASASAHDVYAQTLAELGLAGAVALAAVLLFVLLGMLRGVARTPGQLPVALGTVGLLLHFGLDIDARYPALLMLAAVFLGLVYTQRGRWRAPASWRWPAVAAVLLAPLISLYQSDLWAIRAAVAQGGGSYAQAADDYGLAHAGLVYNPDYLSAEGINWYSLAAAGGTPARADANLALARARAAERLDPHDSQHHQLEGRILALQGNLQGAEAAFRAALKLDPYNHPDYALDLANILVREGDSETAVETVQAMLAQYPKAVVANRSGDATVRPALANLAVLVGQVYLRQGDTAGAKAALARAAGYDPNSVQVVILRLQLGKLGASR